MKGDLEQFQNALVIDKYKLDDELIRQPEIYYHVSNLHITAKGRAEELRALVDNKYAELDDKIREKGEKLKEREIKSKIQATPKMQALQADYMKAKVKADQLSALKDAFAQRAYALKDLTSLYASNYFSTDSGAKVREEAMEAKSNEVRRLRTEKLKTQRKER